MSHAHPARTLTASEVSLPADHGYRKLVGIAAVLGLVGVGVSFALRGADTVQFAFSYLTAYMFWLSIALGGLLFVLIHNATRAGWSVVVRRIAESFMIALPLFAILAIPILMHAEQLYEWSHEGMSDPILEGKRSYLNMGSWTFRLVLYLALWALLALFYYRQSNRQDETGKVDHTKKTQWVAPVGIVIYGLTSTFAAVDWMMSLSPHWYSTIYGVYYFAGTMIATHAVLTLTSMFLQRGGMLRDVITTEHYHDLGKMIFAFTVFWTYIAFSQYFLIWYANIPEETVFYRMRVEHGWYPVTILLMVGHFFVPFFFLMSRHIKRNKRTLAVGAIWMLFIHYVDMFWLVQPNKAIAHHAAEKLGHAVDFDPGFTFGLVDVATWVGVGGLVVGVALWRLFARPMVPVQDPRLAESLAFENFPTN